MYVLVLSDFEKTFEVECDTLELGIREVLLQEEQPIA